MEAIVDKFGLVLIPKRGRDDLGLRPGSVLLLEEDAEGVRLRPATGEQAHVVSKGGVLVFSGTATGDVAAAVETHRRDRLRHLPRSWRK